jgi:hypothetical protein
MILRDAIDVRATPADIFSFFDGLNQDRYLQWHPDHRTLRWTRGRGLGVGNEFYFEEVIAGKLLKKTVVFTRIDPERQIEFAPTFWLMRVFLPRLVFRVEPIGGGLHRFVAEIHLRVGPIGERLNRREFDAIRAHMKLEGVNLKRLVEASAGADAHDHPRR